jgi:DNA-binding transcriptional LysR family regulator
MDFRDLKYFEVIATEGNLGRAAERLHRTQPALTKCIDRLEDDLGAQLFEKDGRGMRLTAAGEVLVRRTRQMAIMVEETAREMQDHAGGLRGHDAHRLRADAGRAPDAHRAGTAAGRGAGASRWP